MRRLVGVVLCAVLFGAGCAPGTKGSEGTPTGEPGAAQQQLGFDSLRTATKMVMTTKSGSDLPKTWNFKDAELQNVTAQLLPVLQAGKPVSGQETAVPKITLIFDVPGTKLVLRGFATNRFDFNGQLYELDQADDRIYETTGVRDK